VSSSPATGVLLAHPGAPPATTPVAVRQYLREVLADPRQADLLPSRRRPLLRSHLLRQEQTRLAEAHRRTWTPAGAAVRTTCEALAGRVGEVLGAPHHVVLGMRHGPPSIDVALDALRAAGCVRVVVVPLVPQYSASATASIGDAVLAWARTQRDVPAFTFVRDVGTMPRFIAALAASVRHAGVEATPAAPLVLSYRGIPQRHANAGDPYGMRCHATSSALAQALGLAEGAWRTTFQSPTTHEPWLRPYTDVSLQELARGGKRSVAVVAPSHLVDGIETLHGLEHELRALYLAAGGETFVRVPCLGAGDAAVELVVEAILAGQAGAPCTVGLSCGCDGPCTFVRD
jgi:ferrochelatase